MYRPPSSADEGGCTLTMVHCSSRPATYRVTGAPGVAASAHISATEASGLAKTPPLVLVQRCSVARVSTEHSGYVAIGRSDAGDIQELGEMWIVRSQPAGARSGPSAICYM